MDWILKISPKWRKLVKKVYVEANQVKDAWSKPYLELWGQHKNGKRYKKDKIFDITEEQTSNHLFKFAVFAAKTPFTMSKRRYVFRLRSILINAREVASSQAFDVNVVREAATELAKMWKKLPENLTK